MHESKLSPKLSQKSAQVELDPFCEHSPSFVWPNDFTDEDLGSIENIYSLFCITALFVYLVYNLSVLSLVLLSDKGDFIEVSYFLTSHHLHQRH